jgi:prevent-host-death family protein
VKPSSTRSVCASLRRRQRTGDKAGQPPTDRAQGGGIIKIESLREVKNNLSSVVEQLEQTGPVIITKNGKSRAVLLAVDESTDLESVLLAVNPRFWKLFDQAAQSERWTSGDEL